MAGALDSIARARASNLATEHANIPRENDAPAAAKSRLPARLLYAPTAPFGSNYMTYMSYLLLMTLFLCLLNMTYMPYSLLDVLKGNLPLNMTYMS
jgi:hypothetical protein